MFPRFEVDKKRIYPGDDLLDLALILQQGDLLRGPPLQGSFAVKKIRNMLRKCLCRTTWRCAPRILIAKGMFSKV
jgi:hypothetical protein